MTKKALVPLAPGFEEIEAVTIIDVLRRAGVEVTVAGTVDGLVEASRGVRVMPDTTVGAVDPESFDLVVLPGGGPGTEALRDDPRILEMVRRHHAAGRLTAAVCAAPTVLAAAGIAARHRVTGHPSVRDALEAAGADVADDRVVVDGNVVTSQGPGTSIEFAFALVERLCGAEKVRELNEGILARV
ncbi:MAG: DJ-1 family glyoxalase III [Planctomycetota bacterium JB042]